MNRLDHTLAVEGAGIVQGEVLERDVLGVFQHKWGHEPVEHERRAPPVDCEVVEAGEKEGDPLEALVVVADEAILLGRLVRPEVIAAGLEGERADLGGFALFKGRTHGGSGILPAAGF